jgi:hypothetical protein
MDPRTLPSPTTPGNTTTAQDGAEQQAVAGLLAAAEAAHAERLARQRAEQAERAARERQQRAEEAAQLTSWATQTATRVLGLHATQLAWTADPDTPAATASLGPLGFRYAHGWLTVTITRPCGHTDALDGEPLADLADLGALLAAGCTECTEAAACDTPDDQEQEQDGEPGTMQVPLAEYARAAARNEAAAAARVRAREVLGDDHANQITWTGHPDATASGELDGLSFRYDLASDTLHLIVDDYGLARLAPIRSLAHLGRILEAVDAGWVMAVAPDSASPDKPALTPWQGERSDLEDAIGELISRELDDRG